MLDGTIIDTGGGTGTSAGETSASRRSGHSLTSTSSDVCATSKGAGRFGSGVADALKAGGPPRGLAAVAGAPKEGGAPLRGLAAVADAPKEGGGPPRGIAKIAGSAAVGLPLVGAGTTNVTDASKGAGAALRGIADVASTFAVATTPDDGPLVDGGASYGGLAGAGERPKAASASRSDIDIDIDGDSLPVGREIAAVAGLPSRGWRRDRFRAGGRMVLSTTASACGGAAETTVTSSSRSSVVSSTAPSRTSTTQRTMTAVASWSCTEVGGVQRRWPEST
jgi:hypothetical protein